MGGEVVVVVVVVIEPFLKPVGWQSNTVLVVESLIALESTETRRYGPNGLRIRQSSVLS